VPRLCLTLAYVGTRYLGWQLQAQEPTVQGTLEAALSRLCGAPIRVYGAGRTDAGVHAHGQVAHCDVPQEREHLPWQRALNALLPQDMAVLKASIVPENFHARRSAQAKEYAYTLWTDPDFVLPQRRAFVWPVGRLDLEAMDHAATYLCGTHDFASFQNLGTPVRHTVRTVEAIWRQPGATPQEWVFWFRANGFLKQMVRTMVGLLVAVGRGRLAPQAVPDILAARDRAAAPATAPPQGLCLERVVYGPQWGNLSAPLMQVPLVPIYDLSPTSEIAHGPHRF
jgi:tRNA pseudouridine38-40 synthase